MITKKLLHDLTKWSRWEYAFSLNEFLKDKGIAYADFELAANENPEFMEIWGIVESRIWENLLDALHKKKIPRSQIKKYISEEHAHLGDDPEEIMNSIESGREKTDLYEKAMSGDTDALLKCSLMMGMMSEETYNEIKKIKP